MGAFDLVHTGDRCGIVKCLGREMRDIFPGDSVVLHLDVFCTRSASEIEELVRAGQLGTRPESQLAGLASSLTTFDICTQRGSIHVTDGILQGWDDFQDDRVPVFDYNGRSGGHINWWPASSLDPTDCPFCDSIRAEKKRGD